MDCMVNNFDKNDWRIWNKNNLVERRTFKRAKNQLQEMECAKQLIKIVSKIYKPEMKILDIGCAAGHYYNSLKKVDKNILYFGIDATKAYIQFAKNFFRKNKNTNFFLGDIYKLPRQFNNKFDITFCCNVFLHLPTLEKPLKNFIQTSKKYCILRTLISEKTHLSKFLYSDKFDNMGNPKDFVYQNTYSYKLIKKIIKSVGNFKIEFLEDKFNEKNINREFKQYGKIQDSVTLTKNKVQMGGSKIFQWKWVKITK